jgi:hypothetical protein
VTSPLKFQIFNVIDTTLCIMRYLKKFIKSKYPNLFQFAKRSKDNLSQELGRRYPGWADFHRFFEGIEKYSFPKNGDVMKDLVDKFGFTGDLAQIYSKNDGLLVHKWHHYIPIYEKYFEKYRGKEIRFLEIGVYKGGSLRMWREYLGPNAVIFGIDIDQECSKFNGIDGEVRIGSQNDSDFLTSVVSEMGGIDVVLDDGSHNMQDIAASMKILFPKLNDGGTYFIEDLHTAYWRRYGGGYKSKNNFYRIIPKLIDDIHSWYHPYGKRNPLESDGISSIHIYDSIVVLEKEVTYPPTHSQVGF